MLYFYSKTPEAVNPFHYPMIRNNTTIHNLSPFTSNN